jgi:CDP-paratose 2-epimerase
MNDVTLITGGAGFIGANVAQRLLSSGERVLVLDNLARPQVERNLHWLREAHGSRLDVAIADVRDAAAVHAAVARAKRVFHFAAQVAVTTSIVEPIADFDVNVRGTLNVLEAIRAMPDPPPLLFTSTNKVYGALEDVPLKLVGRRYVPTDTRLNANGVDESRPLDFHSPYGCSKGAADQYVLDYARTYGLRAVVFRMSCIYGPRQFGTEDQGWVAHFLIRALDGDPITLYGDGRQVRDILFVDDLVDAMMAANEKLDVCSGQAFNIGGGPSNTTSLLELLDLIHTMRGVRPAYGFEPPRLGDQRYYVSNPRRFTGLTGWAPRVGVEAGVRRLLDWLEAGRTATKKSPLPVEARP